MSSRYTFAIILPGTSTPESGRPAVRHNVGFALEEMLLLGEEVLEAEGELLEDEREDEDEREQQRGQLQVQRVRHQDPAAHLGPLVGQRHSG